MGQQEIAKRLGYSRQHTANLINHRNFPEPAYVLAMGRIWLAEEVEKWIAQYRPDLSGRGEQ